MATVSGADSLDTTSFNALVGVLDSLRDTSMGPTTELVFQVGSLTVTRLIPQVYTRLFQNKVDLVIAQTPLFAQLVNTEGLKVTVGGKTALVLGSFVKSGSTLQADDGLQALKADGDDLAATAGDSLAGGGQYITDDQQTYLLENAEAIGASITQLADIRAALQIMSDNPNTDDLSVNFARIILPDNTAGQVQVQFDASEVNDNFMLMTNLNDLKGLDLALRGMEKVLALGSGTVRIDGADGAMVVGDSGNQRMLGGFGSDTLVGGAGNDTLTGGAGADVFGFIKRGHFTITDFEKGVDKLAFDFAGVTTKAQIQSYLTSVTEANGSVTFNFGSAASITLVGVSATGVGADLLFNIT